MRIVELYCERALGRLAGYADATVLVIHTMLVSKATSVAILNLAHRCQVVTGTC